MTVGWQERIVTVVVVLNVSVRVSPATALMARALRPTRMIEARIVENDNWTWKKCFGGRKEESTTRLR